MKFSVDAVFTEVIGQYDEIRELDRFLTVSVDSEETSLLFSDYTNIRFYTGLLPGVLEYLSGVGIYPSLSYVRSVPLDVLIDVSPNLLQGITLREYQVSAISRSLKVKRGLVEAHPGAGKTEIGAGFIKSVLANYPGNAVFVVAQIAYMNQTYSRFIDRGFSSVGRLGGGHNDLAGDCKVLVAVVNSLYNGIMRDDDYLRNFLDDVCVLVLDEVHHMGQSNMWITAAENINAPFRMGLSAHTSLDDPISDLRLIGLTGALTVSIPASYLFKEGYLATPVCTLIPIRGVKIFSWVWDIVYEKGIVHNEFRNDLIVNLALKLYEKGMKVLIFVVRLEHGNMLVERIGKYIPEVFFAYGGGNVSRPKTDGGSGHEDTVADGEELRSKFEAMERGIMIGNVIFDESVDIPSVNALIMAGGLKKYRRTLQKVGRSMRPKLGENITYVFDFEDLSHVYLTAQSNARRKVYKNEEFVILPYSEVATRLGI